KINGQGNGPSEYNFLEDMDLDSDGNLYLLDLRKGDILKFLIDGKFIKKQKFGFMTYKFGVLEKGSYIFDQGTRDNTIFKNDVGLDYKLVIWNPSLQKLNKFLEYTDIYDSPRYPLPNTYNLYRSGNKLNYVKPYEYNIYEPISENEIMSTYHIDFGENKVPKSFYSNYSNAKKAHNLLYDLRKTDYAFNIIIIYETSKYLCLNFTAGSSLH